MEFFRSTPFYSIYVHLIYAFVPQKNERGTKKILKYYNDYINNVKQSTYSNYLVVGSHYRIQNNINDIFHVF